MKLNTINIIEVKHNSEWKKILELNFLFIFLNSNYLFNCLIVRCIAIIPQIPDIIDKIDISLK
jgi:hypothetical protein